MNALNAMNVFLQYSLVSKSFVNMQDVSVLKCVSKDTQRMVKEYVDNNTDGKQAVIEVTAGMLGISPNSLARKHIIKTDILFKNLLIIERVYGSKKHKAVLLQTLNNLTGHVVPELWTETLVHVEKQKQMDTIHFLLHSIQDDCLPRNIIIVYILMSFIFKLMNSNKTILFNRNEFALAHTRLQKVVVKKCINLTTLLREEITLYPYMFIDRVLRKLGDVKRAFSSLA